MSAGGYGLLADAVLLVHLAFVLFVGLGALVAIRWPAVAWAHVPAAVWGAYIELSGGICPLTPLENRLRAAAGQEMYEGTFINRYLVPVIYPAGLTAEVQLTLGVLVIVINAAIYVIVWRRRARRRAGSTEG
jgi:hypothetical protein